MSRVLMFPLPVWGHMSTCLAIADDLARRGGETVFAFVYPPPGWAVREIAAHGHACEWSLRHVRSGLGTPGEADQRSAVIAAETEIIREVRPDLVLHDVRTTTTVAARACGVPVVSVLRCPGLDARWGELWGDVQLVPHPPGWLPVDAPGAVHCRPAQAHRTSAARVPAIPQTVLASFNTVEPQPGHLRLVLDAFAAIEAEWVVCYPYPDDAARSPRVVPWADLDVMLAAARVLVCQGGHGVIGRAMMRGVPVVVLETDQAHTPVYGAALEAAGAGILVRQRDQSPVALREAVTRALEAPALRGGAAALRRSCEALPEAGEALLTVLEARSCV